MPVGRTTLDSSWALPRFSAAAGLQVATSEAYLDWFTMEIDHEKIVAAFNGGYAAAQKPMDEAELLKKLRP